MNEIAIGFERRNLRLAYERIIRVLGFERIDPNYSSSSQGAVLLAHVTTVKVLIAEPTIPAIKAPTIA